MLCQNCQDLPPEVIDERSRVAASRPGWDRMRNVVCDTCGGVLPSEDVDGRLLDRLTRLARFGLVAGAAPILKR
jgi:hypothetical protein